MERQKVYDYIRVLACLCIIGIHSTGRSSYEFNEIWEIVDYILHDFFRISLPVFFLLSGALLLSGRKQESVGEFYKRRFIKIVLPFFVYSLFYAVWVNQNFRLLDCFSVETWKNIIKNILPGIKGTLETYQAVPLWFVYTIIGIYIVAPFLKVMLQNMDEKMLKTLAVVLFVMRCIKNYVPVWFGLKIGVDYIFSGWILYFILGYIIIQPWMEKYYKWIAVSGALAFGISSVVYIVFPQNVSENYYDLAPHMILQACGLFILMYKSENVICKNEKVTKVVTILSKYTFSIYLLHSFTMREVIKSGILDRLTGNVIIRELLQILFTFIVSFVLAVAVDNTIMKLFQNICEKILGRKKSKVYAGGNQ